MPTSDAWDVTIEGNHLNRNHEKIDEKKRGKMIGGNLRPKENHPNSGVVVFGIVPSHFCTQFWLHHAVSASCAMSFGSTLLSLGSYAHCCKPHPFSPSDDSVRGCRCVQAFFCYWKSHGFAALHRLPCTDCPTRPTRVIFASHLVQCAGRRRLCTCQSAPGLAEGESNPSAPSSSHIFRKSTWSLAMANSVAKSDYVWLSLTKSD